MRGYYRRDGTYVRPHYRSRPDGTVWNNWSTRGNVNPHTGLPGTRSPYGRSRSSRRRRTAPQSGRRPYPSARVSPSLERGRPPPRPPSDSDGAARLLVADLSQSFASLQQGCGARSGSWTSESIPPSQSGLLAAAHDGHRYYCFVPATGSELTARAYTFDASSRANTASLVREFSSGNALSRATSYAGRLRSELASFMGPSTETTTASVFSSPGVAAVLQQLSDERGYLVDVTVMRR